MMAATHRVGSHIVFIRSTESVFETTVITTNDNYKTAWGYYNPNFNLIKDMAAHESMDSYRFKAWFFSYEDCLELGLVEFNENRSSDNKKFVPKSPRKEIGDFAIRQNLRFLFITSKEAISLLIEPLPRTGRKHRWTALCWHWSSSFP